LPKIPIIEDLTTEPIPGGSVLLVEFDPGSQWINASLTIAAGWLKQGGKVSYNVFTQTPDDIRSELKRLEMPVEVLEKEDKLRIQDWYTATLGLKSSEKYSQESLKVADLNIVFSKQIMREPPDPNWLRIADNISTFARFNDERSWVEYLLTRNFPAQKLRKSTNLMGLIRRVHNDSVYRQLEVAANGIIDFMLEEAAEETRTMIRIRSMRDLHFDSHWHQLKVGGNFEVTLDK
jgi:KaiC/GvpD/RAD55 family RecA-like ATPase